MPFYMKECLNSQIYLCRLHRKNGQRLIQGKTKVTRRYKSLSEGLRLKQENLYRNNLT